MIQFHWDLRWLALNICDQTSIYLFLIVDFDTSWADERKNQIKVDLQI